MKPRAIFFGSPAFAVPAFEALADEAEVVGVVSQPDKPAGRGQELRAPEVKLAAQRRLPSVPIFQPVKIRTGELEASLRALSPDIAIVVAYGRILHAPLLALPRLGCWNLHASLLPKFRGAAPIQWSIIRGESTTGVALMRMDEGLDTGAVALAEDIPIGPDMTTGELHDKMMLIGADLMGRALAALERGTLTFTPQPEDGVTYAKKIEKAEARIDWSRPAAEVHNLIRGMSPFPGAWFELELNGAPVRVKALRSTMGTGNAAPGTILPDLTIACGEGAVKLISVQREGKSAMDAATFLRGAGSMPTRAS